MEHRNETKYIILCFLASFIFAVATLIVRASVLPPINTALYRVLFAIILLTPFMAKRLRGLSWNDWKLLLPAGFFFAGSVAVVTVAIGHTSVANVNVFGCMMILVTTPASALIFKEKIPRPFLMGAAIAVIGVFVFIGSKMELGWGNLYGDALAFLSAVLYAGYVMCIYALHGRLAPTVNAYAASLPGVVFLFIFAVILEGLHIPRTLGEISPLVLLALLPQILGMTLVSLCLGKLTAFMYTLIPLTQPIMAAVLGWLLANERLTALEIVGMLIILVGIYIAQLKPHESGDKPKLDTLAS